MEALKRARRPVRREVDKLASDLELLLRASPLKKDEIRVEYELFEVAFENLQRHDVGITEQLAVDDVPEEEEIKEWDEIREWNKRAGTLRLLKEKLVPPPPPAGAESTTGASVSGEVKVRGFKLRPVEIRKFSGKLKDWLGFWAQFEKIHSDERLTGSDKFWYLLQSLEPKTDAYETVTLYPASNENYEIVIASLKRQYADKDLQLQVYIREILGLVISNVNSKEKLSVKSLFMKLDSHIRALKSLELEKADPATWLFPLVESCLPETILYNWQKSPLSELDGSKEDPPRTRLDILMSFVEREVQIRQRMDLTKDFVSQQQGESSEKKLPYRDERKLKNEKRPAVPTLSSFHVAERKPCVLCEKSNHETGECYQGKKMTYDQKISILREKRLCFRCTGKHLGNQCSTNLRCDLCHRGHMTILCKDMKIDNERRWSTGTNAGGQGRHFDRQASKRKSNGDARVIGAPDPKKPTTESTSTARVSSNANLECTSAIALQTLLVKVSNGERSKIVRAFIDSGSQRSYLLKSTAKELGLKSIGVEPAIHSLFGGQQTATVAHNKFRVQLSSIVNNYSKTFEIRDQNMICGNLPRASVSCPSIIKELEEKNVTLTDVDSSKKRIELLIGADVYAKIMTGKIEKLQRGAVAVNTELGWTLLGSISEGANEDNAVATYIAMSTQDANIAKLWELEVIGIEDPSKEQSEKRRLEMETGKFMQNISRDKDGRYSVKMPWKNNHSWLPSNRQVAHKRLQSASKKLTEQGMFDAYHNIFIEWEKAGFIERVSVDCERDKLHYLPHRPVIKESLTTPVRPVFDASCRVGKAPSLNDCLFTGENYVKAIPDLIQRFREKKIGFVSDIRKAFQMIGVDTEDRDAMRFLWWKDARMEQLIEYRHSRVMFGATCSPFILGAVLFHHLTNLPEEKRGIGLKLLSTLYVDNCVSSESSIQKYQAFRQEATELLKGAGMDLRMWLSNVDEFEDEKTLVISVLGLMWDRVKDELFINIKELPFPDKITKRIVLSAVQRVYDPIGITVPAVLPMKLLLQRVWGQKLKWDIELGDNEKRIFLKWRNELEDLGKIRIPRISTAGVEDRSKWSLHLFTDASKDAYAAVVFLRVETESSVKIQLLAAKSRVAPLKALTIPKLELMGCLLGKRLIGSVRNALDMPEVKGYCWNDSTAASAWIERVPDLWGVFVLNRVKEIREGMDTRNWRHVPGEMNPADLPSRGCLPSKLLLSRWWEGLQWMYGPEESWPNAPGEVNENEVSAERRKSAPAYVEVNALCTLEKVRNTFSYFKQVRILGWVRRFLHNKFIASPEKRRKGELSTTEINRAEYLIVREIQRESFPKEKRNELSGLEILEDDWGLLRVKTRLTYREDPVNFKYPLILPKNNETVKQLIRGIHEKYFHAGLGFLSTHLRKNYWIVKQRQSIKKVLGKCVRCRKFASKPIVPAAAPLPLDRVKNAEVFEVVGVDLAGPLTLKNGKKVWLVIYTCAVYRAVHFELVMSCSTKAFISSLEKFVEKYRRPSIIYSDNGTNFRGANNLFRKMDWDAIEKNEKIPKIVWKFNPPTSSWWGGWWERLIRTAKDLLKRSVGKKSLNFTELKTVVSGVAEVMNERPLTYVSEDPTELEPLTPSLFLHPFGNVSFPESGASESESLRMRHKYVATMKKELRERFRNEYLSMLVNRHPKKATRELKVKEMVWIGCDNLKRIEWPLGRVIEIMPGKDDVVRVARVLTERGEIVRSVQRLYPLEMDAEPETERDIRDNGLRTRSGRLVTLPERFENGA